MMGSKVFVGNLNYKTTREEIEQLFSSVGTLTDVYLPTDRETGRMRGFAFVTFENDEDAVKAIEKFNGHELGGRALRVNQAEERPRRSFGGGGGGGGRDFSRGPRNEGGGGGFEAFDRGFEEDSGGWGGGGGDRRGGGGKPKGSRRNLRAKKRSL